MCPGFQVGYSKRPYWEFIKMPWRESPGESEVKEESNLDPRLSFEAFAITGNRTDFKKQKRGELGCRCCCPVSVCETSAEERLY